MEGKGEVRRLHIIYFLSRMGRIEHPHLIRVHHLTRNGVYLRDVKRWLGDLRGKDMPEAFAWSYKRRYKAGYVWQDLLDDDLITPISDNEYVLKGSEINPSPLDICLLGEKNDSILSEKKNSEVEEEINQQQPSPREESHFRTDGDSKVDTPTKFSSDISQESSQFSTERSSLAEDFESAKNDEEKNLETGEQNKDGQSNEKFENSSSSFYQTLLNKRHKKKKNKNKNKTENNNINNKSGEQISPSLSSSPCRSSFSKNKSTRMLRNLITCGAVDTNDAVLVAMNQRPKNDLNKSSPNPESKAEICRGDILGGSARVFGTSRNYQQQQQYSNARRSCDGGQSYYKKRPNEYTNQKAFSSVYKPFGGPTCSQCGKSFKPEKMHAHMKSCKGMKKALAKNATSAEKTCFQEPRTSSYRESMDYLLTN